MNDIDETPLTDEQRALVDAARAKLETSDQPAGSWETEAPEEGDPAELTEADGEVPIENEEDDPLRAEFPEPDEDDGPDADVYEVPESLVQLAAARDLMDYDGTVLLLTNADGTVVDQFREDVAFGIELEPGQRMLRSDTVYENADSTE